jgi:hypothetical protein
MSNDEAGKEDEDEEDEEEEDEDDDEVCNNRLGFPRNKSIAYVFCDNAYQSILSMASDEAGKEDDEDEDEEEEEDEDEEDEEDKEKDVIDSLDGSK